jgi:hypothetical protein
VIAIAELRCRWRKSSPEQTVTKLCWPSENRREEALVEGEGIFLMAMCGRTQATLFPVTLEELIPDDHGRSERYLEVGAER